MKFTDAKVKKKELLTVTNRCMNQLVAALRQVDYTDTSKRNMYLIEGMVRTLGYINSSKNLALYFNREIDDLERRYKSEKNKMDKKIRKLKAQREYLDEAYPPTGFLVEEEQS